MAQGGLLSGVVWLKGGATFRGSVAQGGLLSEVV